MVFENGKGAKVVDCLMVAELHNSTT
jgi:hypothetical protein